MSLNGVQYYWLIAVGVVLGQCLTIALGFSSYRIEDADLAIQILALPIYAYTAICCLVVIWDMWRVFGFKLILGVILAGLLTAAVSSWFVLLPNIAIAAFWLYQINGRKFEHRNT